MPNQLRIRKFLESDLAEAGRLREGAGWNQTDMDWRRFLAHEPDGCFVAEWKGIVAGTVTTTRHGEGVGWIGMMLVHPDYRRRGIATELMTAAMNYLEERGVACIKLDATPEGAPVYERLGFRPEWEIFRWSGHLLGAGPRMANKLDVPMDFDFAAFGTDRSEWIGRLAENAAGVRLWRDEAGRPSAFGMWRRGMRANYLGPASAADAESGRAVVDELLGSIEGETFWDVPEANKVAVAMAEERGFARARHLLRMWTGERAMKGVPAMQFALADPATG